MTDNSIIGLATRIQEVTEAEQDCALDPRLKLRFVYMIHTHLLSLTKEIPDSYDIIIKIVSRGTDTDEQEL